MKVYYAFTKPGFLEGHVIIDGEIEQEFIIPKERATVAVRLVDGVFQYGVSICSTNDNFSRSEGRRLAEERMEAGFGVVGKNEISRFIGVIEPSDHEAALFLLKRLVTAVESNMERFKRKLRSFSEG